MVLFFLPQGKTGLGRVIREKSHESSEFRFPAILRALVTRDLNPTARGPDTMEEKMIKINGWMTMCLGAGMLLMACDTSTNSGSGPTLTEDALIGKWTVTSIHNKGWMNDDAGNRVNVDTVKNVPSGSSTAEYKSDKTVSINFGGFPISGTWSIKGDSVITVESIAGYKDTTSAFVSIDGKSGTFITHEVDMDQDLIVTTSATKP